MKKFVWVVWITLTVCVAGYYAATMFFSEDKSKLLVGEATHGHYQIELACDTCHTDAFGGDEALQQACVNCHGEELELANDSHPKKKFNDPRNADLLEIIDARYCVSCHAEHQQEQTRAMGLTLPNDYCFYCHEDVGTDRPSHEGLTFESCASAGCHNFHDNRALYEAFLVKHAAEPWLQEPAVIPPASWAMHTAQSSAPDDVPEFEDKSAEYPDVHKQWLASRHAESGVHCGACHTDPKNANGSLAWGDKPQVAQCQSCHEREAEGFFAGRHGMRLPQNLPGITPSESRLVMKTDKADEVHSCHACHNAHETDTAYAATAACLSCHDDQHSLAFESSPHAQLIEQVSARKSSVDSAVTCATCHLPREPRKVEGEPAMMVQHNQNLNLRPNEKMIRSVCLNCHGLAFSIDALADRALIDRNFAGQPAEHIPSIDWAMKREKAE